jgi:hypothetical protein
MGRGERATTKANAGCASGFHPTHAQSARMNGAPGTKLTAAQDDSLMGAGGERATAKANAGCASGFHPTHAQVRA